MGHVRTVSAGSQARRARTAVLELGFDEGVALVREGRTTLEEERQRPADCGRLRGEKHRDTCGNISVQGGYCKVVPPGSRGTRG